MSSCLGLQGSLEHASFDGSSERGDDHESQAEDRADDNSGHGQDVFEVFECEHCGSPLVCVHYLMNAQLGQQLNEQSISHPISQGFGVVNELEV